MTQPIAGIKRRFFALLLDILLLGVLGGAVIFPLESSLNLDIDELIESVQGQMQRSQAPAPTSLLLVGMSIALQATLWSFYFIVFLGKCGQTPGKRLLGIKALRTDEKLMGYKTAAIRCLIGYTLSFLTLGLGFIWALLDKNNQCLHDKIAGTLVVNATFQKEQV